MTPKQAIVAGTRNGLAAAFMEKEIGTIEPGKPADLIMRPADPLGDIDNLDRIEMVVARGRIVGRSGLPEKPVLAREGVPIAASR